MHIQKAKTVKERWDSITTEYTEKGTFTQTDLCTCFLESKCPEKGNIQQFLDELCIKREELLTVGIDINKKYYCSTIISLLPIPLANFASNQLAFTKIYSSAKSITPDSLILLISEEYKQQWAQCACHSGSGNAKDKDKDEALSVVPGRGKGKECKPHGVYWNCREKCHYKDKCTKPVKQKKNPPKKSSTAAAANAVIESDSGGEGAFFMEDINDDDMPDLQDVSDSKRGSDDKDDDEGSNWFTDIEETSGCVSEEQSEVDWSETSSFVDLDLEAVEIDEYVAQVGATNTNIPRAKIYDSGCSKHLTPYRDALKNCVNIPPKSFQAANKQSINAVGMGEMTIDVPNGTTMSQLKLTEVLYSPQVGYTLMSVGCLIEKGFSITFSRGKCTIQGPDGSHISLSLKTRDCIV